jgi:hypothetical protein
MTGLPPERRWQWWMREWRELRERRLRAPTWIWRALAGTALVALIAVASPYWTLWRLSRAASSATPEALAPFVDLNAVRDQIRRRLNKDVTSQIGEVSDPFIDWIAAGLQREGTAVVDKLVTLEWIAGLLQGTDKRQSLFPRLRYAFYDPPRGFLIRIQQQDQGSVSLLLRPSRLRWRICVIYY